MQAALDILGIPCWHSYFLFSNVADCALWSEALDAKFHNKGTTFTRKEWDQVLGSWGGATDAPVIAFAHELQECYPEAKVLLVERDTEKWYKSFNDTVIANSWNPVLLALTRLDPWLVGPMGTMHHKWIRGWMGATSKKEMQEKARPFYEAYNAHVKAITPEGKLLVYELGSGWEPLCEFLGKPVPEVPFPKVNETEQLNEKMGLVMQLGMMNVVRKAWMAVTPRWMSRR
jgi:hypothetical protein